MSYGQGVLHESRLQFLNIRLCGPSDMRRARKGYLLLPTAKAAAHLCKDSGASGIGVRGHGVPPRDIFGIYLMSLLC